MAIAHPRWTAQETPHARIVRRRDPYGDLTEGETETLRAVCRHSIAGAAHDLFVERSTIKNRLTVIYRKLGIAGDTAGKRGDACYRLGRWDQERGEAL